MAQYLKQNQFEQTPVVGMVDKIYSAFTFNGQLNPAASGKFNAGNVVSLIASPGAVPVVDVANPATEAAFLAVVPYNFKKNQNGGGAVVELLTAGTVVYMEASAAITAGAQVTWANTTANGETTTTVATAAAGQAVLGVAIVNATAGGLVRVMIKPGMVPASE